jgi:hypothetical protein
MTQTSKKQGPPPEPRSYHTASLIGDKVCPFSVTVLKGVLLHSSSVSANNSICSQLLIFGGKARRQWFSDVIMLDIPSRGWNPITLKVSPLVSVSCVVFVELH